MDRNIKLIIKVDGKILETSSIVSLLYQMEYNKWNKAPLLTIGNLELSLKRTK